MASWKESMASDGFAIGCDHSAEGERFRVTARDDLTALTLLYEHDVDVLVPIKEADLRIKLTHVGLSANAIEARIQLARAWSEAVAGRLGPVVTFES